MAKVFEVSEKEINEESSTDTIEKWDSLTHVNLIMFLEQEFAVTFETEEIIDMVSFKLISLTLSEKVWFNRKYIFIAEKNSKRKTKFDGNAKPNQLVLPVFHLMVSILFLE